MYLTINEQNVDNILYITSNFSIDFIHLKYDFFYNKSEPNINIMNFTYFYQICYKPPIIFL